MAKKSLKIFLTLIFCAAFSCAKTPKREIYILSNVPEIQEQERQDHKFCNSLDLNSGSTNKTFSADLYWRCRLSSAKSRLKPNISSPQNLKYNSDLSDLITKISLHLSEARESVFIKENKRLDKRDHAVCLSYGFDFDVSDRLKTDEYLLCRKRLIDEDQLDPPYGNEVYLQYPNRAYNLSFVLDHRIDKENKKYEEAQKNYPICLNFFQSDKHFKECSMAQDQSKQCFAAIDAKKFKKESDKKTICQKQAYVKFPDSFLKNSDQRKNELTRIKNNADVYNQNNFAALGIIDHEVDLFEPESALDAKNSATEKQKKLEQNINSKKGLYSRYDLTRLRQKYIYACQQNADFAVKKYVETLQKKCDEISNYKPQENLI